MNDIYVTYTKLKTKIVKYFCKTVNIWAQNYNNICVYIW